MRYPPSFDTAYHQIYLQDKTSPQDTGDEDFWTEEATTSRLAVGGELLGIGLECYGEFKGELNVLEKKEDVVDFAGYDHVVEGGLELSTGVLQVLDCPNSTLELEVDLPPGKYRVRIYSSNLASVGEDESGDDFYLIEIWPDSNLERKVIKQYNPG